MWSRPISSHRVRHRGAAGGGSAPLALACRPCGQYPILVVGIWFGKNRPQVIRKWQSAPASQLQPSRVCSISDRTLFVGRKVAAKILNIAEEIAYRIVIHWRSSPQDKTGHSPSEYRSGSDQSWSSRLFRGRAVGGNDGHGRVYVTVAAGLLNNSSRPERSVLESLVLPAGRRAAARDRRC